MEQTGQKNPYEKQQKISFFGFLAELQNFIAVAVSAIFSGSLIVWMDFIDSLCNVLDAGFVTLLSHKLKRNLKYEYNYGIGKIEAISSLCCEGVLMIGLLIILTSSVYELMNPKEPSGLLIYVVLLKVINVIFDAVFLRAQYQVKKSGKSELTNSKFHLELKNIAFDSAALVSILVCWAFRAYRAAWYISPVLCVILVCGFFSASVLRVRNAIGILTDRTLPEAEQMKILKVLARFHDRYEEFEFLSSRISGETVYIDLRIRFRDDTQYAQLKALCHEISDEIKKEIPKCKVSIVIDADDFETDDEKNAKSMRRVHKLTTEQLYMFNYQLYTPMSTMYNNFKLIKFKKGMLEPSRLANAAKQAIQCHPALLTKFSFNEDGDIVQSYDASLMPEIPVERISDADFDVLKDSLVQPFKMIDARLFRIRIFETEDGVYLFGEYHHTILDGLSFKAFMRDMAKAYEGKPLSVDHYYLTLQKREEAVGTPLYIESRAYFEKRYDGDDWIGFPPIDHSTRENEIGRLQCGMEIDAKKLHMLEKKYHISRNEFFIVVSALAISFYANYPNVKLSWIYNGRSNTKMMRIVGLLYRDLPVAFRFEKSQRIREIFIDAHEQVQNAIRYSCYPYVEKDPQVVENDLAAVLYQRDILNAGKFGKAEGEDIEIKQNKAASQNVLDIEILDDADGLQLLLDYASSRYEQTSMERFRDLFLQITAFLVQHDIENDITVGEIDHAVRKSGHC